MSAGTPKLPPPPLELGGAGGGTIATVTDAWSFAGFGSASLPDTLAESTTAPEFCVASTQSEGYQAVSGESVRSRHVTVFAWAEQVP